MHGQTNHGMYPMKYYLVIKRNEVLSGCFNVDEPRRHVHEAKPKGPHIVWLKR